MVATEQDESTRLLSSGVVAFLKQVVDPLEVEHADLLDNPRHLFDESGRYSAGVLDLMRGVRERAAAAGFYTAFTPVDLGGAGLGYHTMYEAWRALCAHAGPGSSVLAEQAIAHWVKGPSPLLAELPAHVRERVLPDLLAGTKTMCLGISEPDAGSDVWGMKTVAARSSGGWVVNGSKQWITNAPYADYAIFFAVTDKAAAQQRRGGITAFFTETDRPGFTVDSVIKLFGELGGNEGIISIVDCALPDDHVVGVLGRG